MRARIQGDGELVEQVLRARDGFAPGFVFPLAFVFFYTVPYLHLVDYTDIMPPPGARMAFLAALGLIAYLGGLSLARLVWPTASLEWPRVNVECWRSPVVLVLAAGLSIVGIGILAYTLRAAGTIPLLATNVEAARRSIG